PAVEGHRREADVGGGGVLSRPPETTCLPQALSPYEPAERAQAADQAARGQLDGGPHRGIELPGIASVVTGRARGEGKILHPPAVVGDPDAHRSLIRNRVRRDSRPRAREADDRPVTRAGGEDTAGQCGGEIRGNEKLAGRGRVEGLSLEPAV